MSSQDKRAHPRFPLVLAVDYPGSASAVRDYTENLSAGGLFIRTERAFEVGDRVALLVSFPELLQPVELEAEILRLRDATRDQPAGVAVWIPPDRAGERRRLQELTDAAARAAEAHHPAYRVLLVEDNSLVAAMYTSALRRLSSADGMAGIAVEVASDGNEAFARLLVAPAVDLVITDVYMPVMSGFALLEKVRAEPSLRRLPVVVISSGGAEERERVSRLGADFFLQKPVKYQDIVATVRTLLNAGARPSQAPSKGASAPDPVDLVGADRQTPLEEARGTVQDEDKR